MAASAGGWGAPAESNGGAAPNGWKASQNGGQHHNGNGIWPDGPPAAPGSPGSPCPITVQSLQAGEVVDVFHRYCQDPNGYFMVQHSSSGFLHPSIGVTDGWTQARVKTNWNIQSFNPNNHWSWVEIQWMHPLWYSRRGFKLDVSRPDMVTQKVLPDQIRKRGKHSEAHNQPCLTLFHLRWGGERHVNPVTEGAGGWGQIGSTPSDNYINTWESFIYQALGPNYEIVSAFIQGSDEIPKISAPLVRHMMKGQHLGALYFMWPIVYQDGHDFPAYVHSTKLLELMVQMEATGIPSRFPHHSHLYRVFASKEWAAQMCLHPLLSVPLTTKVSRQAVAVNPAKAAEDSMKALQNLAEVRASWSEALCQGKMKAKPVHKGVAKLGWSWEAMDVQAWKNAQELTGALAYLVEQPGSFLEFVFVQEWVDFDVEMRHFVVEPDMSNPSTWKAKKIIYTVFKSQEGNCFRDFDRFERKACLAKTFGNDDAALADAERQAEALIGHWLQWLQAQTHEMPVVTRFDILAKRIGPGRASVMTGELTELGGCFLGWPKGPEVVFAAMLRSCFKDPYPAASKSADSS